MHHSPQNHQLTLTRSLSLITLYDNITVTVQLQHQLELERSARHDLEMHTRALESQKALLQEEVSALKTDLEDGV